MTRDAAYWDRKSRRDKVLWTLSGWLYLPLLLVPILFPSVYYGFELQSTLVRIGGGSALIVLYPLCSACFLAPHDGGNANLRRRLVYSIFAFIYLLGNLLGVRGTVWYWSHVQLLIALFFAHMTLDMQIDNGTMKATPTFQWLDKAIAVILIAGMVLHFRWYTWKLVDVVAGIMLSLLAITSASSRPEQLAGKPTQEHSSSTEASSPLR
jgi:hypothetical protein